MKISMYALLSVKEGMLVSFSVRLFSQPHSEVRVTASGNSQNLRNLQFLPLMKGIGSFPKK